MRAENFVRINCTSYDPAEWSKWEIIANELKVNYGGELILHDTSVLALGQFLELSNKIISRQLRAKKRKKKK